MYKGYYFFHNVLLSNTGDQLILQLIEKVQL
jgi:hypothetical protein